MEISIIVPVYNALDVLPRCIESILGQTFRNYELLLIDDGSTDQSGRICETFAKRDGRIRVIHKQNGGVSSARNTGLDAAKGDYVVFIDSDDYVECTYLAQLFQNRSDLTFCGTEIKNAEGVTQSVIRHETKHYSSREEIPFLELYHQMMLFSPWSKLFRRDLIEKGYVRFPEGISWGEDGMFVADYLQHVYSATVLDYAGYYYCQYSGEQTLSTQVRAETMHAIVYSREYGLEKLCNVCPGLAKQLEESCICDICFNCAYLLGRLVRSRMDKRTQQKVLGHYLENSYVQKTLEKPDVYYSWDITLQQCLSLGDARKIIASYRRKRAVRNRVACVVKRIKTMTPR